MKNKKIILGLATVSTVIAPLATVISCGFGKEKKVKFPEEITGITFKGANKHGSIDHEITQIIGVVITTDKDASNTLSDGETIIATYTLQKNYSWNDGTTEPKTLTTNVLGLANKTIHFPSTVEGLTFKGANGQGSIDHKVTKIDHVEITTNQDESNTLSDGNEVVVTYKLKEDYYWVDGTNDPKKNTIKVSGLKEKTVDMPSTVTGLTFQGANEHGSIDQEVTPIKGVTITTDKYASKNLKNGDVVTVTYTLKEGYYWVGGSTSVQILTKIVQGLKNGNAFTGTWKSQTNKGKFLNLKDTDEITANIFLGESNLTGLTITTGIITDQNAIAGSDAKPGARNIVSLTINQPSLTFIPKSAFYDLKLTTLDLTKCTNLTTIKQHAFHCSLLTTLDLTKNINLESIERYSFFESKLTTLDLTNNSKLTTIGRDAFYSSELTTLDLTNNSKLTTIGDSAFFLSELTKLDLSGCSKLTNIGRNAFLNIVNDKKTIVTLKKETYNLIKDKLEIIFNRHDKINFKTIT